MISKLIMRTFAGFSAPSCPRVSAAMTICAGLLIATTEVANSTAADHTLMLAMIHFGELNTIRFMDFLLRPDPFAAISHNHPSWEKLLASGWRERI